MYDKRNTLVTIGMICAVFLVFTIADFRNEERRFSEAENRILAVRPEFSREALFRGNYTEDYEEYVTDQFVSRDAWIKIKTLTDIALQKKEINGVYLGEDDYLIEVHDPANYTPELEDRKIAALADLVERWDALVMLVPSADNILTDKLPEFAPVYDEAAFLEKVKKQVGTERYVDVYSALKAHAKEEIYYRTDHHWTSLGAYYGLKAWEPVEGRYPYPFSVKNMTAVSEDFEGTLHSRINLEVRKDKIMYFPETEKKPVKVIYDMSVTTDRLYEESFLETKNQYGFFLNDNHALTEIDTGCENGKTLFVLKDSYGNSMIPLLTHYYQKIYAVDLRYYNGRLFDLMEQCEPENGMDVLVLYNCIHFLKDFKYY